MIRTLLLDLLRLLTGRWPRCRQMRNGKHCSRPRWHCGTHRYVPRKQKETKA
jgi:hypothetical protein